MHFLLGINILLKTYSILQVSIMSFHALLLQLFNNIYDYFMKIILLNTFTCEKIKIIV